MFLIALACDDCGIEFNERQRADCGIKNAMLILRRRVKKTGWKELHVPLGEKSDIRRRLVICGRCAEIRSEVSGHPAANEESSGRVARIMGAAPEQGRGRGGKARRAPKAQGSSEKDA